MKLNFCVQCGATENLHHHHVIPKVKGGSDDEDNIGKGNPIGLTNASAKFCISAVFS